MFFLPAAAHTEKEGTFTNTQRLLQWHHKAIDPPGDCRSDLWFAYHLGRRIREKLAARAEDRDRPVLDLTWDYPTEGVHEEPSADAVLREVSGFDSSGRMVAGYTELRPDGSTACGCWIYSGCFADGVNQTARRRPGREQSLVAPRMGLGLADEPPDALQPRLGGPAGPALVGAQALRVVGRGTGAAGRAKTCRTSPPDMRPDYEPPEGATGPEALRGDEPFIMQADGRGWLFVPSGLADGPFPTHYEPHESPVENPLYRQRANPAIEMYERPENRANPPAPEDGWEVFPYVMTTYRLTEHHTAGGMSRTLPYLSELQPEMFCEVARSWRANAASSTAGGRRSSRPARRSRRG